jgi:hypothetical protein
MSLQPIIDGLGAHLLDATAPRPVLSGGVAPAANADLPAVTLSVAGAARVMSGVGRVPRPPRIGALRVTTSIDLSDPVLRTPGEPDVELLSGGRTALQLPHAPLVTADGSPAAPLGSADLQVSVGATIYAVVDAAPAGDQVRPTSSTGVLVFGAALPSTGTLALSYFIGQWDVRSARYQGVLAVEVFGATAAVVEALSRSVDSALLREPPGAVPGLRGIAPASWGGVRSIAAPVSARVREMTYRIDYEIEDAVVPAGGGVISLVRVRGRVNGDEIEPLDVTG